MPDDTKAYNNVRMINMNFFMRVFEVAKISIGMDTFEPRYI